MATRKLAANVHVGGRFFEAGSSPEKEYADQITNPNAWGEGDSDTQADSEESGARRRSRRAESE